MFTRQKRWLLISVIVGLLTIGITAGAVMAQDGGDGGDSAPISFADTGPGLAPQELGQVLDRFYRQDTSRSRSTGGVGLGLTIAKQLVEAHNGRIIAESSLGQGSTFGFELPLARRRIGQAGIAAFTKAMIWPGRSGRCGSQPRSIPYSGGPRRRACGRPVLPPEWRR